MRARTQDCDLSAIARWLLVLFGLCLGTFLAAKSAAADAPPDLLTPAERAWLGTHPRIVLGAGEDWAPSVVKDAQGRISGFAVDHLDLLNQKLGTHIRLEAGPWHEIVAKAEAGEIDGLILTAPLQERKERFSFTAPYYTVHDFVFLRTPDQQQKEVSVGLNDLRGKRVGYLKGTLRISRVLANYAGITAVEAESHAVLAQLLLRGEIDAAIASYSFEYWRAGTGAMGFGPARLIPETEARMVMTIRKDRSELVGILDKGLAAISREEVEPLYRRWFGADYVNRTTSVGPAFSPEERDWLAQHPVLRVGIDPNWAPVEFIDANGVARGMTLAYLDRLGGMTGTRFEVVQGRSWTEALGRLRGHEVDLLPAIAVTPERRESIAFTEPYLSFPAAIFSAADVAYLGGLESLKGRRVAVVRGEAVEAWLQRERPDLELVPVEDTREALRMVADGEAFAFVGNLVTTSYYIGQSGLTRIKVAGETPFFYRLGMGVRSDWPILARILQKALDAVPAADRDAIYRDWLAIRYEHNIDYSLLWKVLAGAALALLVVFAERTYRLNRANSRLKRLAREISLVEERERRRLAGELHDSPMQKLALAQMRFGAANRQRVGSEAQVATGLELMREAIDELRSLQFELSPPMLYQEGLAATLRWLATHASERSGVEFSFRNSASAVQLPQELAIVLFQCARELVYNVAKHASAHAATIELGAGDNAVVLAVSDDGTGIVRDEGSGRRRGGGFGLFSVRERLALFGGELSIASDSTGTRVRVRMPLAGAVEGRAARGGRMAAAPAGVDARVTER